MIKLKLAAAALIAVAAFAAPTIKAHATRRRRPLPVRRPSLPDVPRNATLVVGWAGVSGGEPIVTPIHRRCPDTPTRPATS